MVCSPFGPPWRHLAIHLLAETIEPLQLGRLPTVRSHDYHLAGE